MGENFIGSKTKTIRRLFEKNEVDKTLLSRLYRKYSNIGDIDLFLSRAGKMFPNLNCGIASNYLQHELGEGKIINGKFNEENHTFLLLDNGRIIDITADQYGGPEIYYGPIVEPWSI